MNQGSGRPPAGRVLVVDDERDVADLVVRILRQDGFETVSTQDSSKVSALAREFRPDLVVLDFCMPKLLGPEVALLLKRDPDTRDIPILFVSGMSDDDHRLIGAASGGSGYLEKPFDGPELLQAVRGLLGSR